MIMIWLANIFTEGGGGFLLGALACFGLIWWKDRAGREARVREANAKLEAANREAEAVLRDARLAAGEEAQKIREQTEQSFAERRRERAEIERRLSEREALVNAQLEGLVAAEKGLREQKAELQRQGAALSAQQKELDQITRDRLQQLEAISHLTPAEARAQFLKEIELEASRDAGNLARHIVEEARSRAEDKAACSAATSIR